MKRKHLELGDYVLATKWSDGDPRDPWFVGFYGGPTFHGKHVVTDTDGKPFYRGGGLRRCERISNYVGHALIAGMKIIEMGSASVWYWRYHPAQIGRIAIRLLAKREGME